MPASTPAQTADHSAPADTQFKGLEKFGAATQARACNSAVEQPDFSGYDPAVRAEKHRKAMAHPVAKTDVAVAADDAKVSAWSVSAFIGAAVVLMGLTKVRDWVRARIGSGR